MIKDYLYAVGKYLPPSQRAEVLKDIEANIYDYLEENYGSKEYSENEIEVALLFLGNPKKVAEGYLDRPRCLIGPPYFDIYYLVVKLAVFGVAIGIGVSLIISFNDFGKLPEFMLKLLAGIWQAGVSIVGTVTIIFAALYRFAPEKENFKDEKWSTKDLEKAPDESEKVKLTDLILESAFAIIFLVIINFDLLSGLRSTEIDVVWLNDAVFSKYLIWINLVLVGTLLLNLYLLIRRRWQVITRLISILLDMAGIWIFGVLAFNPGIWDFSDVTNITPEAAEGISTGLGIGLRIGFGAIVVITAFEIYKHIRFMVKKV